MDRGGKVILLLVVLFRLTTSKCLKGHHRLPTRTLPESLLALKGVQEKNPKKQRTTLIQTLLLK